MFILWGSSVLGLEKQACSYAAALPGITDDEM